MKFTAPTPIQLAAIPPMLNGKDVIGQAKTGSGKTAAYGLPLLERVKGQRGTIALVLLPTRELAVQVAGELLKMGKHTGVSVAVIYGGQPLGPQARALGKGPQIVVGTPGRTLDLAERGALDLESMSYVVLDEADRMLDMGFIDDVDRILGSIKEIKQMALFSATMPKEVISLASKYMKDPETIMIDSDELSVEKLDQYYTLVSERAKLQALKRIISSRRPKSCLVFCRTRARAWRVSEELRRSFSGVEVIHGGLPQRRREMALKAFMQGRSGILVATEVVARGIDAPNIELVINYDFPDDPLMYFHRVGRTARAGRGGASISFITDEEVNLLRQVEGMTEAQIKPLSPDDEEGIMRSMMSTARVDRHEEEWFIE